MRRAGRYLAGFLLLAGCALGIDAAPSTTPSTTLAAPPTTPSHPTRPTTTVGEPATTTTYSTGNFAFPSAREESSYTAAFRFEIAETGTTLTAIPVRIVDGRPVLAEDSRPGILDDLTARSFRIAFDAEGEAHPADEPGVC